MHHDKSVIFECGQFRTFRPGLVEGDRVDGAWKNKTCGDGRKADGAVGVKGREAEKE